VGKRDFASQPHEPTAASFFTSRLLLVVLFCSPLFFATLVNSKEKA
jgi:hypothetical protein